MVRKIKIDDKELIYLYDLDDLEHGKITVCIDELDNTIFVIDEKIITDDELIIKIKERYGLIAPDLIY